MNNPTYWFILALLFQIATFSFPSRGIAQDDEFLDKGTIYQVQIGSFAEAPDLSSFQDLKDLGELTTSSLTFEPGAQPTHTRVFLGKYLGSAAAKAILKEVRKRGYKQAFLESDTYTYGHSTGLMVTSAIQLGAYRKLHMEEFAFLRPQWELFVIYEKGLFKVLTSLHDPGYRTMDFPTFILGFDKMGFEAYPRSFR